MRKVFEADSLSKMVEASHDSKGNKTDSSLTRLTSETCKDASTNKDIREITNITFRLRGMELNEEEAFLVEAFIDVLRVDCSFSIST